MKFGRVYQDHLENDGYPQHWIDTSISYRQLKKVIKRVEKELAEIGLDIETLKRLLQSAEKTRSVQQKDRQVQYSLNDGHDDNISSRPPETPFHPKLLIAVDDATGEPLDFGFTPETLQYLHEQAVLQKLTEVKIVDTAPDGAVQPPSIYDRGEAQPHRMVEIALTSDSEFFNILHKELNALESLQTEQETSLQSEVHDLSKAVSKVARPSRKIAKSDINQWRQIFQLYLESQIFFATHEQDHGAHSYAQASKNYQLFVKQVKDAGLASQFRKKESVQALERFFAINSEILKTLSFQELNHMALMKILKKFDKRTSFNVNGTFALAPPAKTLSRDIAQAVCFQVTTDLLAIVPQLDDYLCPVCCDITWRPVRLACSHVFCIRCLVVMQNEKKTMCPLCREKVLLQANTDNIDPALSNFLKEYFPNEVKAKQKSNEYQAGVDEYGEHFDEGCMIM
ncbi:RING-14 protein [Pseudovirgaria hyperparasitica]|uniref:RING-14 protein n=1 Tax=Pseudovirgaria hyperparasitica TaxID=470096 RepID=A0A6A6WFG1_9PEZI|nr:RING-14 protein [Pseudovirgaria hyperparasitica]KAF2760730.1 RING-14 protein [Pseudovirgaria hyperparasitica]